jgi:HEAT repeat protein
MIALIASLVACPLFAIDMEKIQTELGSDDYTARKKARIELQLALADATKPGANGQERKTMEKTILVQIKGTLPLTERLYLIRMLELFGSAESAAPLNELLSNKEPHVRDSARRALAAIPGDAASTYLIAALKKSPATEQGAYLQALAYRRDAKAVAEMTRALQSKDAALVSEAALAISKAGKAEQIPAIKKALTTAPAASKVALEAALIALKLDAQTAQQLTQSGSSEGIQTAAFAQLLSLDAKTANDYLTKLLPKSDVATKNRLLHKAIRHGSSSTRDLLIKALPTAPLDSQIVILSAMGQHRLTDYEPQLIAMLGAAKGELQGTLIDTLSRIGGETSFDPINKALIADPENKQIIAAISQLKAPSADKKTLLTTKDSKDTDARIHAIQLLALRNIPGGTDLLNSLASNPADNKVKAAALNALEIIGNEKSVNIFVQQILSTSPADKDVQRSLKRLSQHLGDPQTQWEEIYSPALKTASSDKHREALILIMDGIPCQGALDYLTELALNAKSALKPVAIRSLQRWPSIDVGNAWISIASRKDATEKDIATAQSSLKRILSKDDRRQASNQVKLAVKAIKKAPNAEFKREILSVYAKPNRRIKKHLKGALPPLQNDPDVGEQVKTILKGL